MLGSGDCNFLHPGWTLLELAGRNCLALCLRCPDFSARSKFLRLLGQTQTPFLTIYRLRLVDKSINPRWLPDRRDLQ
ncbi:hypothetical protein WA026_014593, partial [Henosepilachna vigintioctopunctata]